jgi:RNA polymerase sigma-70 factor (ECF subfamily)
MTPVAKIPERIPPLPDTCLQRKVSMAESPTTKASLLVRIRDAGDSQAWAEFTALYAPLLYRWGRKYGLQDADAADLTQDVLRVVVSQARRFAYDPQRGSFRGWLFTVARNQLRKLAHGRRRQAPAGGDTEVYQALAEQPAPEAEAAAWDREYQERLFDWAADKVRGCVVDSTWRAFWRTAVEGQGAREVGAELGMSVGAVYIAKSRVLARIREEIQHLQD